MSDVGFFLQSIVVDDRSVQVSYFLEGDQDENGLLIRTASINPLRLKVEVEELFDAAYQLISAWEGARRESAIPAPRGFKTTERETDD